MLKPPRQILEDNPGLKKYWTANDVGYLYRLKLVRGVKPYADRNGCLIEEKHVLKLFRQIIEE